MVEEGYGSRSSSSSSFFLDPGLPTANLAFIQSTNTYYVPAMCQAQDKGLCFVGLAFLQGETDNQQYSKLYSVLEGRSAKK